MSALTIPITEAPRSWVLPDRGKVGMASLIIAESAISANDSSTPVAISAGPDKITVIFGRKVTSHYRGKLQTEIEDMHLPTPVVRSHYGNGFVKQYVRDHLILRTEAATNNVNDYGVNKAVENLPKLQEKLSTINDNYQNVSRTFWRHSLIAGNCASSLNPPSCPAVNVYPA